MKQFYYSGKTHKEQVTSATVPSYLIYRPIQLEDKEKLSLTQTHWLEIFKIKPTKPTYEENAWDYVIPTYTFKKEKIMQIGCIQKEAQHSCSEH